MSNFAQELNSIKLRKVNRPKDYSNPKLVGFLTDKQISEYQDNVLDCNIEVWYETIKNQTFPSVFCPILLDEAKLFIKVYERNFKDKTNLNDIDWRKSLDENDLENLKNLESRLNKVIGEFNKDGFVFVKTSSRSAKDSPIYMDNFRNIYKAYLNQLNPDEKTNENEQIKCLLKAAFDGLKFKAGQEVIEMFFKSERIFQDMLLAVEKKERFNENFVIRKFFHIDIDMEFRGFVYNGKLTCLSQYNYLIYSERLQQNKTEIQNSLKNFFYQNILNKLSEAKFPNKYVIDFALISSKSNVTLIIIYLINFKIK